MADLKVSAMTASSGFVDTDEFPTNKAGASRKVTGTQLKSWAGNIIRNQVSAVGAGQAPVAATRTYITGSQIAIPASGFKGSPITFFQWRFSMTKTAAGTAASTFDVAFGTAGTTADAAQISFTKPAGTAAADEAWVTIDAFVQVVGPVGTAAGQFTLIHNLAATGHAVIPCVVVMSQSGNFDTSTPTFVGICITTGAADVITIKHCSAQAFNL